MYSALLAIRLLSCRWHYKRPDWNILECGMSSRPVMRHKRLAIWPVSRARALLSLGRDCFMWPAAWRMLKWIVGHYLCWLVRRSKITKASAVSKNILKWKCHDPTANMQHVPQMALWFLRISRKPSAWPLMDGLVPPTSICRAICCKPKSTLQIFRNNIHIRSHHWCVQTRSAYAMLSLYWKVPNGHWLSLERELPTHEPRTLFDNWSNAAICRCWQLRWARVLCLTLLRTVSHRQEPWHCRKPMLFCCWALVSIGFYISVVRPDIQMMSKSFR